MGFLVWNIAKCSAPGGKLQGDAVLSPLLHALVAWWSGERHQAEAAGQVIVWASSPIQRLPMLHV